MSDIAAIVYPVPSQTRGGSPKIPRTTAQVPYHDRRCRHSSQDGQGLRQTQPACQHDHITAVDRRAHSKNAFRLARSSRRAMSRPLATLRGQAAPIIAISNPESSST
jgi:hypothetical protein